MFICLLHLHLSWVHLAFLPFILDYKMIHLYVFKIWKWEWLSSLAENTRSTVTAQSTKTLCGVSHQQDLGAECISGRIWQYRHYFLNSYVGNLNKTIRETVYLLKRSSTYCMYNIVWLQYKEHIIHLLQNLFTHRHDT